MRFLKRSPKCLDDPSRDAGLTEDATDAFSGVGLSHGVLSTSCTVIALYPGRY
jgi:hypothetical protein